MMKKADGKLTSWAKAIAIVLGTAAASAPVVVATANAIGLDTIAARQAAIDEVTAEVTDLQNSVEQNYEILDAKIDCLLQGVSFENCPASAWRR